MTDSELRALVRDAVARHFELQTSAPDHHSPVPLHAPHASHAMHLTLVNVGDACLIEPAVTCNHCGYCKSHGH